LPLLDFSCRDFRCLRAVEFSADPQFSLIYGANASGKTSLLEAVAYLGRGRSFRHASTDSLIRHGATEFLLHGSIGSDGARHRVGIRNGQAGLELSIDGSRGGGLAELAHTLPLQVIDPEVHNLVAGGPEQRRRYLDWVGFHVEHGFLDRWRRYRRVLKQRNAVLRTGAAGLESWDREFIDAAAALQEGRLQVVERLLPALQEATAAVLGEPVGFSYLRGWNEQLTLDEALLAGRRRDEQAGSSQQGPHRAELRLRVQEGMARKLVSRGQQKLLACAMILAATEVVQQRLDRRLLLLLDDPAAELDGGSLRRLMDRVAVLGCQVVATALSPDSDAFPLERTVFHVKQGELQAQP
jgi:DNA replication and repair protein RecF